MQAFHPVSFGQGLLSPIAPPLTYLQAHQEWLTFSFTTQRSTSSSHKWQPMTKMKQNQFFLTQGQHWGTSTKLILIKQEGNQSSSEFQTCVLIVCFLMVIDCLIDSKPTSGYTKHLQPKYVFWVLAKLSSLSRVDQSKEALNTLPEVLESSSSICETFLVYMNPWDFHHQTIWAHIISLHILHWIWVVEIAWVNLTRHAAGSALYTPTLIWVQERFVHNCCSWERRWRGWWQRWKFG